MIRYPILHRFDDNSNNLDYFSVCGKIQRNNLVGEEMSKKFEFEQTCIWIKNEKQIYLVDCHFFFIWHNIDIILYLQFIHFKRPSKSKQCK